MNRLLLLCTLFFVAGVSVRSDITEYKHEDREPTKLEKQTFDILKKKFPGGLLDKNLETLHLLSDSDEYLNFLSKKYPEHAPITAFQDFYYTVPPPKEYYFNFFAEQFGVQSMEDIDADELSVAHETASGTWTFWGYKHGGDKPPYLRGLPQRIGIRTFLTKQKGRKMLERRGVIRPNEKPSFMGIRHILFALNAIGSAQREEDFRWIKHLLKKYGESDGMIWLAVQDSILLDRILYTFSTDTTFLKSVFDPIEITIR